MVEQVDVDARGIVAPDRASTRWSLVRHEPSARVRRLVDRYWIVRWDLPEGNSHTQEILPHPVTNLVFEDGGAVAGGVATGTFRRELRGTGRGIGVMFRPGGFRPLVEASMDTLTDRIWSAEELLGPSVAQVAVTLDRTDDAEAVAAIDAWLADRVPSRPHACETTAALVERAAADPQLVRVDQLAELAGTSVRTLQRRFLDHVGVSPKWVLRRYRLYEAAERARGGGDVDWAAVAHDLGYSDQAHLVRDFASAFGRTPTAYVKLNRLDGSHGD